jgi:hypothetical protein
MVSPQLREQVILINYCILNEVWIQCYEVLLLDACKV